MESEVFSVAIHYQKLTETELPTFIDMRIQQLREEGATENIDLKPALLIIIINIWQMEHLFRGSP